MCVTLAAETDNKVIESGNKINGLFGARKSRCITSATTGASYRISGLIAAELLYDNWTQYAAAQRTHDKKV